MKMELKMVFKSVFLEFLSPVNFDIFSVGLFLCCIFIRLTNHPHILNHLFSEFCLFCHFHLKSYYVKTLHNIAFVNISVFVCVEKFWGLSCFVVIVFHIGLLRFFQRSLIISISILSFKQNIYTHYVLYTLTEAFIFYCKYRDLGFRG